MLRSEPPARETGDGWQPWERSWQDALYGPAGFFLSGRRGARHDFSTSATRGPRLAEALAVLLQRVLQQLNGPSFDVTEIGAGDGRLLSELRAALPPALANRGRFTAVELGPRPADLPAEIGWSADRPGQTRGLLLAHEWLDNVPCPVVEVDSSGHARYVEVDQHGRERLGAPPTSEDTAWLDQWWPLAGPDSRAKPGDRAEIGLTRDAAWRAASARLTSGLALAIDYAHTRATRPDRGSLTGYRDGREVAPVPDGNCDITAHVALDACAEAGDRLVSQRDALAGLGVTARPQRNAGLAELRRTGEERQLLDPQGAGGFGWLLHPAGQVDVDGLLH